MTFDPVISASALASLRDTVIVDARQDGKAYAAGHMAGAFHARLEHDLAAPVTDPAHGGRHPLPDPKTFAATLGRWSITPSSHIVVYDDQNGANASARLWWMLRAIGHRHIQVVDGGLEAMRSAGVAMTGAVPSASNGPAYPFAEFRGDVADIEEVEVARRAADRRVLDVRAAARFHGDNETIDPIAGHIPGAKNAPFADNLSADGTFKSAAELRELYERLLAGTSPAQTVVHCGSGVTACHTLLALDRAGLLGAKLYIGSWSEWCRQPDRPREPPQ